MIKKLILLCLFVGQAFTQTLFEKYNKQIWTATICSGFVISLFGFYKYKNLQNDNQKLFDDSRKKWKTHCELSQAETIRFEILPNEPQLDKVEDEPRDFDFYS